MEHELPLVWAYGPADLHQHHSYLWNYVIGKRSDLIRFDGSRIIAAVKTSQAAAQIVAALNHMVTREQL